MKFLHAAAFAVVLTLASVPVVSAQEPEQDKEKPKQKDEEKKKQPSEKEKPQPTGAIRRSGKTSEPARMTGQRLRMSSNSPTGRTRTEVAAIEFRMNDSAPASAPSTTST